MASDTKRLIHPSHTDVTYTRSTKVSALRQSCDPCRRRKVKCSREIPCGSCVQTKLRCTYHTPPKKRGPKPGRANIICGLRHAQCEAQQDTPVHRLLEAGCSQGTAPTQGLLTREAIEDSINFYFTNMYTTLPILHRETLSLALRDLWSSAEIYCLAGSLVSLMILESGMCPRSLVFENEPASKSGPSPHIAYGIRLLREIGRVREGYDYRKAPTLAAIITSFFIFGCFFCLEEHDLAWPYLKEAISLAYTLGLDDESNYLHLDPIESSRRRRMFWILFVTERAYALQQRRPTYLMPTIALPDLGEDPDDCIAVSGLLGLVEIFAPFDKVSKDLSNVAEVSCSAEHLAQLELRLSKPLRPDLAFTENQTANLKVQQQWLRLMVCLLRRRNGYLTQSMTLGYPIAIARDLVRVASKQSKHSLEVHGIGLVESFFDVAFALTDVLPVTPLEARGARDIGPLDYLADLLKYVCTLQGGPSRFVNPLLARASHLLPVTRVCPSISTPLLLMDPRERAFGDLGEVESPNESGT